MNRFALSLLRVFKKPIPDVFRDEVMNPIGASTTWKWVPYTNAYVDVDGKRMASVSGGTRWGGGMWINTYDMARFGLLWLRNGKWGDKQIVPPAYVKMATTPSRARTGLRLPVVAEHEAGAVARLAGRCVQRAGQRRQHHLHLAEPRSRRGVALERAVERGIQARRRVHHELIHGRE